MNAFETDVNKNLKRNYLAHSIEGGVFMGGAAFVSAETVLPKILDSMGAPGWLISLAPVMMMMGFVWPPLLTAHLVERLKRLMPFCLIIGVFQRLPYLLAGIFLLHFAEGRSTLAIAVTALCPLISGIIGGINSPAWWELITRIIPPGRRASSWALRFVICAVTGICSGAAVKKILDAYPGMKGYGYLHLCAFLLLSVSYAIFAMIKEPPTPPEAENKVKRSLSNNLRSLPGMLRNQPTIRLFILLRLATVSVYLITPWLAIHTLKITGKTESFLGVLIIWQMSGAVAGNIVAGWIGDKTGGKQVCAIGIIATICMCITAAVNTTLPGFLLMFLLYGVAWNMCRVGLSTLQVELCPVERRPTYLSLLSSIGMPAMLIAGPAGNLLRKNTEGLFTTSLVTASIFCLALLFLWRLPEPRLAEQSTENRSY